MPKTKKRLSRSRPVDKTRMILFGIIIVLVVTCTILSFAFYNEKAKTTFSLDRDFSPTYVSLGAMQYNFDTVNHKVTKRTDASIGVLKTFLTKVSNDSRCGSSSSSLNGPGYVYVVANSKDEKQVLLAYGCYYPGPSIYAIKTDQGWKTISPTNHFDAFDIPYCDYLTENNISPEVAPVCANGLDSTSGVVTGNPKYLNR